MFCDGSGGCRTTGGDGVNAASDSPPPPGLPIIAGGLRVLMSRLEMVEISGAVAVRPSGSPLRRT